MSCPDRPPTRPPKQLPELLVLNILAINGRRVWPFFSQHHYLSDRYNGNRAFLAVLPSGEPVAFTSVIRFPHGSIRNGWRGHRTVVLPDFQGLGIGVRLSDWLGEYVRQLMDGRFYSRTSHPRLGAYRDASPFWRPTSANRRQSTAARVASQAANLGWVADCHRIAYSHEYLGRKGIHPQ